MKKYSQNFSVKYFQFLDTLIALIHTCIDENYENMFWLGSIKHYFVSLPDMFPFTF